ncbi:MAG: transglutaminase-like domain-containing protein [Pseudomarimonas sp.]
MSQNASRRDRRPRRGPPLFQPLLPWLQVVCWLVLAVFALPAFAVGVNSSPQWYSVHLDGRKIGQMVISRSTTAEGVETHQRMQLVLQRDGQTLPLHSEQTTHESNDGQPLAFSNMLDAGGSRVETEGEIHAGVASIRIRQGERVREQTIAWPSGALLVEGERLAAMRTGDQPGSTQSIVHFDIDALRALPLDIEVIGYQDIALFDITERTLALRQTLNAAGTLVVSEVWVNPSDFALRRIQMPMLGVVLDVVACDQACAEAPNQAVDVLAATTVQAPRALTRRDRKRSLSYQVGFSGEAPIAADLPGQRRNIENNSIQIIVDPRGSNDGPPDANDLLPNRWLQSDHPTVTAFAKALAGKTKSDAQAMRRLQSGVAGHIATKSLRIGYASALETIELAEGDCTEHALLLAALGRARGIPTRVASGLAYVPSFAGRSAVFVPHAWVYAWVDGRWQGFDAALPHFGSGHLALDVGDGDPFGFYGGLNLLGRLQIDSIERAKR